jgi:hypothetical protein
MHDAQQLFFLFFPSDDHAGVLVFIQQRADLLFRGGQIDMFNVMTDTARDIHTW